jgi:hypothetical protein
LIVAGLMSLGHGGESGRAGKGRDADGRDKPRRAIGGSIQLIREEGMQVWWEGMPGCSQSKSESKWSGVIMHLALSK